MAAAIATCFATSLNAASNLPTGGSVAAGSATFNQVGNTLNVTNSNGTIINWNTFSIGAGYTTNFIQPSASSSVLNRVLSADPSVLLGTLTSNGRVFLINPNGIYVGAGARIDVASFTASTLNLSDANFLANKLQFDATPDAGSVVNQGSITTPSGGSVYLVAPNVSNEGIITTPQGETILAAGQKVTLLDTGTPGVSVEITGAEGNATNLGQIVAEAGRIGIAGVIVKNSGTLNASSVVNEGGRVFLKASQDAYVDGNGKIAVTGSKGGKVEVLGNRVAVTDNAKVNASGTTGGGTVLLGGDFQGKPVLSEAEGSPAVQNSTITYFGPNASIKADATTKGNGGKVIIWADDTTRAYGKISAKGAAGGNGGLVETSGKRYLDANGISVKTGRGGVWLLDPKELIVAGWGGSLPRIGDPADIMFTQAADNIGTVSPAALAAVGGSVELAASQNLYFLSSVALTAAGAGLTATAGNALVMANGVSIVTNGGAVSLQSATSGFTSYYTNFPLYGAGSCASASGCAISYSLQLDENSISTGGGAITLSGSSVSLGDASLDSGGGDIGISASGGGLDADGLIDFGTGQLSLNASSSIYAYNLSGNGAVNAASSGSSVYLYAADGMGLTLGNVSGSNVYISADGSIDAASSSSKVTATGSYAQLYSGSGHVGSAAQPLVVDAASIYLMTTKSFNLQVPGTRTVNTLDLNVDAAGLGSSSSIAGGANLGTLAFSSDGGTVSLSRGGGTTLNNLSLDVDGSFALVSLSGIVSGTFEASGDLSLTSYAGGGGSLYLDADGAMQLGNVSGISYLSAYADGDITLGSVAGASAYLRSYSGNIRAAVENDAYELNMTGAVDLQADAGDIGGGAKHLDIKGGDIDLDASGAIGASATPVRTTSTGELTLAAGTTFNVMNTTALASGAAQAYTGLFLTLNAAGMGTGSSITAANFAALGEVFNPTSDGATVTISDLGTITSFTDGLAFNVAGNLAAGDFNVGANSLSLDASGTLTTGDINAGYTRINQDCYYCTHGAVSLGAVNTGTASLYLNGGSLGADSLNSGYLTINSSGAVTIGGGSGAITSASSLYLNAYGISAGAINAAGYADLTSYSGAITLSSVAANGVNLYAGSGGIAIGGGSGTVTSTGSLDVSGYGPITIGAMTATYSLNLTNYSGDTVTGALTGRDVYVAGNGNVTLGAVKANAGYSFEASSTGTLAVGDITDLAGSGGIDYVRLAAEDLFTATAGSTIRANLLEIEGDNGIDLTPATLVRAVTANLDGNDGAVSANLTDTDGLTLKTSVSFAVGTNTTLDSLSISGTAAAIGASTLTAPGQSFDFAVDGSGNLDIYALNSLNYQPLAASVQVDDKGINAYDIQTYGGAVNLRAYGDIGIYSISTLDSATLADGGISLESQTGSFFGLDGAALTVGTAAVTLAAGEGSVGGAYGGIDIYTNGPLSSLTVWARDEVNVSVLDGGYTPGDIVSLTLGVNGSGSGAINITANNLPAGFLTRGGGNLMLAALPATPLPQSLSIIGRDGNLDVTGVAAGDLSELTAITAGHLTVSGGIAVDGALTLSAGVDSSFTPEDGLYTTYNGTGDLVIQPNTGALALQGGDIFLRAGRDVLLGDAAGSGVLDIDSAGGYLEVTAGIGDLKIQGGSGGGSVNINSVGGSQQYSAGGDILVTTGAAAGATVTLAAGSGGQDFDASGDIVFTAQNAALTISGDDQSLSAANSLQLLGGGASGSIAFTGTYQNLQAYYGDLLVKSGTDATATVTLNAGGGSQYFSGYYGANGVKFQAQAAAISATAGYQSFYSYYNGLNFLGGSANASVNLVSSGSQYLFTYGAIDLAAGNAANAFVRMQAASSQSLTSYSGLSLTAGNGGGANAELLATSGQSLNIYGSSGITMTGATGASSASRADARIDNATSGTQTIYTYGNVMLTGGGEFSTAAIRQHGGGGQSVTSNGGAIVLATVAGANSDTGVEIAHLGSGAQTVSAYQGLTLHNDHSAGAVRIKNGAGAQKIEAAAIDVATGAGNAFASASAAIGSDGAQTVIARGVGSGTSALLRIAARGAGNAEIATTGATQKVSVLGFDASLLPNGQIVVGDAAGQGTSSLKSAGDQTIVAAGMSITGGAASGAAAKVEAGASGASIISLLGGTLTQTGGSGANASAWIDPATLSILTNGAVTLLGGTGSGAFAGISGHSVMVASTFGDMTLTASTGGASIEADTGKLDLVSAGTFTLGTGTSLMAGGASSGDVYYVGTLVNEGTTSGGPFAFHQITGLLPPPEPPVEESGELATSVIDQFFEELTEVGGSTLVGSEEEDEEPEGTGSEVESGDEGGQPQGGVGQCV